MPRTRALLALATSLGLHAIPLSQALAQRSRKPVAELAPSLGETAPAAVWPGDTFDVEAVPAALTPPAAAPPAQAMPTMPSESGVARPTPVLRGAPSAATATPEASDQDAAAPVRAAPVRAAPEGGDAPEATRVAAGAYGAAEARLVSAPLGKGLLRVLPRVAFATSVFHELPFGAEGKLRFAIELDAEGRPQSPVEVAKGQPRSAWLEALLGRAVLLLRGGAFSLPPGVSGPTRSHFELAYQVVRGDPSSGEWLEPDDLAEIGRLVEPTELEPGRAHFRYNSGREVHLVLTLVQAP